MEIASETPMHPQAAGARFPALAEPAFEAAFHEIYPRLVAIVCRIVGERAQAEELVSDAFVKLYTQPLAAHEYQNLGGWLYRTATRLGIDWLRTAGRRQRYELEAGRRIAESGAGDSPLDSVLRVEERRRVRAALARLKPIQSQILLLRSSGLSYRELATALDLRLASIGTLLARAEAAFERAYLETARRHDVRH